MIMDAALKLNAISEEAPSENTYFESHNSRHLEKWWPYWNYIETIESFLSENMNLFLDH